MKHIRTKPTLCWEEMDIWAECKALEGWLTLGQTREILANVIAQRNRLSEVLAQYHGTGDTVIEP